MLQVQIVNGIHKHFLVSLKNQGKFKKFFSKKKKTRIYYDWIFRKALTEFQVDREKIYHTKQLDESPQARASFVINTLYAVAKAKTLT